MEYPELFVAFAEGRPWVYTLAGLALLLLAVWLSSAITRQILMRMVQRLLATTALGRDPDIGLNRFITRLAHVVPALVLSTGIALVAGLPDALIVVVRNVANAYIVLTMALAVSHLLDSVNVIYSRRPRASDRPIKGYLQLVKIAIFAVTAILIIASLLDRSPLILFSGLGAMAAVLMLIFQDTLLSLVASVQLSSTDMVRVGDWIEMPSQNADGDVIDIALHTVTVRNWDRTVTSVPTKKLVSDSFKNWRFMSEGGGRRIKRSLWLDQHSVRFLEPEEVERFRRFVLLDEYLDRKEDELRAWNARLAEHGAAPVNQRRVTNLGTFRAYVEHYLRNHPAINQDLTMLVRQLQPTETGLPLEIWAFTSDTRWGVYEGVQSDIFDHLLAILPEFGLRVFQAESDAPVDVNLRHADQPECPKA